MKERGEGSLEAGRDGRKEREREKEGKIGRKDRKVALFRQTDR